MFNLAKTTVPWSAVKTITAVAVLAAGGFISTTATAQSRGDSEVQRADQTKSKIIKVSDITARIMIGLETKKITPTQAGMYLTASQDRLKSATSFVQLREQLIADSQAGEISREDIRHLLGEFLQDLKEQMVGEMTAGMKKAIQKGDMTQAEADEVLGAYETLSGFQKEGLTRESFAKSHEAMQEMVANGDITQQQMDDRLLAMREMMKPKTGAARGDMREEYAKAKAELDRMVKDGKITQDQADARLNRMVERMKQAGSRGDQEKASDECMELRRELGEAVRSGEITREEAGKKWKESDCGR